MESNSFDSNYTKIQKLGEGAFGKVYLYQIKQEINNNQNDNQSNTQISKMSKSSENSYFALKKLKINYKDTNVEQLRQVQNLKKFQHPNIMSLLDIVHKDKGYKINNYLVFDYGVEIMEFFGHKEISLTKVQLKQVIKQIIEGIKYMHSLGYLHRDIKPSNIFCYRDGTIKIGDFSITRSLAEKKELTSNITTRFYRAPEIIYGSKNYSYEVDIWSLGCTLAELILHEPLFQGSTDINQLEIIFKIIGYPQKLWPQAQMLPYYLQFIEEPINKLTDILPNEDQQLVDMISQMLTLDPKKRPSIEQIELHPYLQNCDKNISELSKLTNYIHNKKLQQMLKN